jgi:hypothetical protein
MNRRRPLDFGSRLVAFLVATSIAVVGLAMWLAAANNGARIHATDGAFVTVFGIAGMLAAVVGAVRAARRPSQPEPPDDTD